MDAVHGRARAPISNRADPARRTGTARIEMRAELARSLAALVGVEPEQLALTPSTTDGCNIVLAGLDLQPDDEIVTTTDEHFGLLGPLHASRRARRRRSQPDPDALLPP